MERDIVGELSAAVRERCMRMGLYYSGGFDWSVRPGPVASSLDALNVAPQSPEYIAYADGQWRELIARYEPAVLWNDIGYPTNADALALFAEYYNAVPDGVVNDRFSILPGLTHHDYSTPEFSVLADISPTKFETVRGMGRGFGYNRNEGDADLDSAEELIHLLIDVVSKNGNLLLNVGPLADGTIPPEQASRLRAIGAWLAVNGEAIFASRPWTRAASTTSDGTPVRFTASADGATIYAIVMGPLPAGEVTISGVDVVPSRVRLLGSSTPLVATATAGDVRIGLPGAVEEQPAYAFALTM
jgi:alpha-L-fucosidase